MLAELREIAGERLRLVDYDRPFNFSAKINLGAVHSEGEHLLLLNDDIEVITPDWIERMVMYSAMPEIGAVGGRLLWEDGRLQHVGVALRTTASPGHLYHGFAGDFNGYANDVLVAQNCLAVTGACLMTRRELFEEVGGLSTILPLNYNDIDYCLKLAAGGRRVVYDPDLVLYHFESSSRSTEVEDWEKERLRAQVAADDRRRPLLKPEPSPRRPAPASRPSSGWRAAAPARDAVNPRSRSPDMNYERLYSYRFQGIDQDGRIAVWREISPHVHGLMGRPQKVLDPAAGRGEFIGAVPAKETWAVDAVSYEEAAHKPDTKVITAMIMDAELPENHFDGVFVSNFLEHLYDQEAISAFLEKMHGQWSRAAASRSWGPTTATAPTSTGTAPTTTSRSPTWRSASTSTPPASSPNGDPPLPALLLPRHPPPSPQLTRMYLKTPAAWKVLGKQFLVIGRKS